MEVVTLGETMVLFDPIIDGPLRYVDQFRKRIGGAESNLAIGLARLGKKVGWISQLGNDELGEFVQSFIRGEGVDTSQVTMLDEASTGVYIKERVREGKTQVYYYRTDSAASKLDAKNINWEYIKQAKIIHLSGITPLLSENNWRVIEEVFSFAKKNNITISFDPNIRINLWKSSKTAKKRLLWLSEESDILLAGLEEAKSLLNKNYCIDEITKHFYKKGVKYTILKDGSIGTYFSSKNSKGFFPSFKVNYVVDPIGAGDGFNAGFLSSILEGKSIEEGVKTGSIVGAMVVSTYGDIEGLPNKRSINQFLYDNQDVVR